MYGMTSHVSKRLTTLTTQGTFVKDVLKVVSIGIFK
jgi:hypothetical protein